MSENKQLKSLFPDFPAELLEQINRFSIMKDIPEDTGILREGQYVKVIPVVVSGLIKVFTRNDDSSMTWPQSLDQALCFG